MAGTFVSSGGDADRERLHLVPKPRQGIARIAGKFAFAFPVAGQAFALCGDGGDFRSHRG